MIQQPASTPTVACLAAAAATVSVGVSRVVQSFAQPSAAHPTVAARQFSAAETIRTASAVYGQSAAASTLGSGRPLAALAASVLVCAAPRAARQRRAAGRAGAGQARQRAVAVAREAAGHAVIMQNKGGGHGEIGFHLALALQAKGLKVTLLQDSAAKKSKVPYRLYEEKLPEVGVVWVDPSDAAAYAEAVAAAVKDGPPVTHIFDNFSKEPSEITPLLALAKGSADFKLYSFVSSAGMYTSKGELLETSAIKEPPTGQRLVELKLDEELPGKWSSFRPQYIYGPYTNKREYLDWFLERANAGLPLGVPGDGSQLVNLAHCEDVAALLSSVVGKEEAAGGEVFNCGTTEQVTYRQVCEAAGSAAGKAVAVVSLPAGTKTSFPFRPNQEGFYVSADKAKAKLGWEGAKHKVLEDIAADGFYTQDFKELGLDQVVVDTSKDGL